MALDTDPRIPIVFASAKTSTSSDAVLRETVSRLASSGERPGMDATVCFAGSERMSHAIGCACCTPRSAVAEALGRLFLARARGEVPWFTRVVAATVTPAGEAAVRAAVERDPIAGARFRIG